MKKSILLAFLCVPILALGQASRFDTVLNSSTYINGVKVVSPMGSATVAICTAPANAMPCTNYATIYTDSTATVTAANPATADANGNVGFWGLPGQYQYTVVYSGQNFGPYSVSIGATSGTSVTFKSISGILFADQFTNLAALQSFAGSTNPYTAVVPTTYAGTDCPALQNNNVFHDFRAGGRTGSGTSSYICDANVISYNTKTVGLTDALVRVQMKRSAVDATGSIVSYYPITQLYNATVTGGTVDGFSAEAQSMGTLSGTLGYLTGAELPAYLGSTGGTVSYAIGALGYVQNSNTSTTAIANAYGVWGKGGMIAGVQPTNSYSIYADRQYCAGYSLNHCGSSKNYSLGVKGIAFFDYDSNDGVSGFQIADTGGANHYGFWVDASNNTNIGAVGSNGVLVKDSSGTLIATFVTAGPTFAGHITTEGVTATGATGTGKFVFNTSPALTTPNIGAATGTSLDMSGASGGLKIKDMGTCTMASGACTTQNLGHTYGATAVCFGSWNGNGTLTGLLKFPSNTTSVTPASSVNTDTAQVNWFCLGN